MSLMAEKRNAESFNSWVKLKYESPGSGEFVILPVISGSMLPSLIPGREIKIKCVISWRECQIGDIIVFKGTMGLTAHRLLLRFSIFGRCFLFQKGDSSNIGNWIKPEQVVGVVVETEDKCDNIIDLTTPEERLIAKKFANKQLIKDIRFRLLIIPRWAKKWLLNRFNNIIGE